tara:strand:+ start:327 stop:644 length:318 start_codon:yes stop_codon:yes gene_type:complete
MDITTILIVLFIVFLFYCDKYTTTISKKKIEHFHNSGIKNFYNFQTLNRPPMPSPYQCTLNFNCSQGKPSDKYGNVCKKCISDTFPNNIVMARVVGSTRQPRKLY